MSQTQRPTTCPCGPNCACAPDCACRRGGACGGPCGPDCAGGAAPNPCCCRAQAQAVSNGGGRAVHAPGGAPHFDGVKVFSATKQKEREELGEVISQWLARNAGELTVVDKTVAQSSDQAFHCLTIIFFYRRAHAK